MSQRHPFYANLYALVIGIDTCRDDRFEPLGEAELPVQEPD
jgi:hypothetical protein